MQRRQQKHKSYSYTSAIHVQEQEIQACMERREQSTKDVCYSYRVQAIVVPLRIEKGMARESYCALTDSSHTIKGLGHLSNEKNKTEIK